MTDTADGLPVPQRYWGILTIALGLIMAVMDGAIANVPPGSQNSMQPVQECLCDIPHHQVADWRSQ